MFLRRMWDRGLCRRLRGRVLRFVVVVVVVVVVMVLSEGEKGGCECFFPRPVDPLHQAGETLSSLSSDQIIVRQNNDEGIHFYQATDSKYTFSTVEVHSPPSRM